MNDSADPGKSDFPTKRGIPSFEEFPRTVKNTLVDYFNSRHSEIEVIGTPVIDSAVHLESFVLNGGKRIRPLFAWAGFMGAGGLDTDVDPQAMIKAASALELIQGCALIHDDLVDASDTRRGNPTVHRQLESYHRERGWSGDPERFGQAFAILLGDLALVWADDMFQSANLPAASRARAMQPWQAMRTEVISGQMLDISLEASGNESIALAETVNRFKTAAYTIERPLHLGAAIAGADNKLTEAFRGFGRDIGLAFQLRDDELGVFGDPAVTGKPAGDDLREGKRTVLLGLTLQRAGVADPAAANTLRKLLGKTSDPEDINRMAEIIDASGARQEVERRIDSLTESGLRYLETADVEPEVATMLERLALKATARSM